MKTQNLGKSKLVSSRLSYGCMRYFHTWNPAEVTAEKREHAKRCIYAAADCGYTLFDHADVYCRGECEAVFGEALRERPGMRDRLLIATKCGIHFKGDPNPDSPHRFDFSREHILASCEASLKRLSTDRIDVYQLHRPDALMNPAEIAEAFELLKRAGKAREFGVSNFSPSQVAALQKHLPMPLVVNQVEVHLGRLDCLTDGTLDQCLELGITPLSWSPLGGGFLGEGAVIKSDHPQREQREKMQAALDEVGARMGVSRTIVALAWLLKHPAGIIPIVGSTRLEHIREAVKADEVEMGREDWYRLYVAGRGRPLP